LTKFIITDVEDETIRLVNITPVYESSMARKYNIDLYEEDKQLEEDFRKGFEKRGLLFLK
jgi:hypothetical protein